MHKTPLKRSSTSNKIIQSLPKKSKRPRVKSKTHKSSKSELSVIKPKRELLRSLTKCRLPTHRTILSDVVVSSRLDQPMSSQADGVAATSRQMGLFDYYSDYFEDLKGAYRDTIEEANLSLDESSDIKIKTEDVPDIAFYSCDHEASIRDSGLKGSQAGLDRKNQTRALSVLRLEPLQVKSGLLKPDFDFLVKELPPPPVTPQNPNGQAYQFPKFFPNIQTSARFFQHQRKSISIKQKLTLAQVSPPRSSMTKPSEPLNSKTQKYRSLHRKLRREADNFMHVPSHPMIALLLSTELPEDSPENSVRERRCL